MYDWLSKPWRGRGDGAAAQQALDNLADFLVEDILAASDAETLAEAAEDGIDVDAAAAEYRAKFNAIVGRCPGAEAARAAIPARDIIEIGGDVAEAADSLLRVRRLIDNGLDSRLPEAAIKRRVLARIEEAMRQLGIVVAELRTVDGQP